MNWHELRKSSPRQKEFSRALKSRKNARVLYGGAGFGGKSYGIRTAAVDILGTLKFKHEIPEQWVVIFCDTYPTLRDRQIVKISEEFRDLGRVKESTVRGLHFEFEKGSGLEGSGIYLRNLDDSEKYRSFEVAAAFVDELTTIQQKPFGDILYIIRSPLELPFLPFGAGSNPDGVGHSWVKKLWIDRDFSGETLDASDVPMDEDDYIFVQALPTDNPTWEHNKTSFYAGISNLSPAVQKARLEGSWEFVGNARFTFNKQRNVFNYKEQFPNGIPKGWRIYRGIDYGKRAAYCCLWAAMDFDGNLWVFKEDYWSGLDVYEQATRVAELTGNLSVTASYLDPACWSKLPYTNLIPAKVFNDAGVRVVEAINDRIPGWNTLDKYFGADNGYPDIFIASTCTNLIRQIEGAPYDTRGELSGKREDIDPRFEDHALDALRYLAHSLAAPPRDKITLPTPDSSEEIKKDFMRRSMTKFWDDIDKSAERNFRRQFK